MTPAIPQTDPKASYLAHAAEIDAAIRAALEGGRYILGPQVTAFETEFSAYLGSTHAIGVASGTDALHLALRVCGIGLGDMVATVSHTAVATVAAIELAGATPLLVDIDPKTFTLDAGRLEEALRGPDAGRIKAVIPVHLYGCPADMPAITGLAARHGIYVIEDCAQSHGAALNGRKTGTWGHLAAFSFYPTKNLGALGDGGALVTGDAQLAGRARRLREYGWSRRYISEEPGMNTRIDELQAAILRIKLRWLDADNACRRELAQAYQARLPAAALELPHCPAGGEHVYHQYVVRSERRDDLQDYLRRRGIGTLIHYPVPVHQQPAYQGRICPAGPLPETEHAARQVLSLPLYPELGADRLEQVAQAIAAWDAASRG